MPSEETQFKPGVSPNPGGRPKGIARKVKELCGEDGDKALRALAVIAWGTPAEREAFFGEPMKVSAKDRAAAAEALLDRGFGRPTQTVEHRGDAPDRTRIIHEYAETDDEPAVAEKTA